MSVLEGQTNPDNSPPTGNKTTNPNQFNQNGTNPSGGTTTNPLNPTTPLNNYQQNP